MGFCTLEIAGVLLLRAEDCAPPAEYALFDASEIELRALQVGTIREVAYRTSADEALERLESSGVTASVVDACTDALKQTARGRYTRGLHVDEALPLLRAAELFDGYVYDREQQAYEGLWVDLQALARDLALKHGAVWLQVVGLHAALRAAPPGSDVALITVEYMKTRRPGERSHRRVQLGGIGELPEAIRALGSRPLDAPTAVKPRSVLELLQSLKDRQVSTARFAELEAALVAGRPPLRGPLADRAMWSIDRELSSGPTPALIERIERVEREQGEQPATIYLRARAAFLVGAEPAHDIAVVAEKLASAHGFPEAALLAAQAWLAAGAGARAAEMARTVLADQGASRKLRELAEDLATAIPSGMGHASSAAPPTLTAGAVGTAWTRSAAPPVPSVPAISQVPVTLSAPPLYAGVPHVELALAMPPMDRDEDAPIPRPTTLTPAPPAPARVTVSRDLGAEPLLEDPAELAPIRLPGSVRPPSIRPQETRPWMRGASLPPFKSDAPPPDLVGFHPGTPERAETLSMPGAPSGDARSGGNPDSVAEARVLFTQLSRALGRDYRERYGIELWTDVRGLESVQTVLRERFPNRIIATPEEAEEVRRCGAFVSEVLARGLGGSWVDIAPTDLGYWAMLVPPGTRVWPFGRVLRLVLMGPRERDLVSYYLELTTRAR